MRSLRTELRAALALSIPLSVSVAGDQLISLVDTMVAGRLGALQIAATGVGAALLFAGYISSMGVLYGLDPLAAQAIGANRPKDAHRAYQEALLAALGLALPAIAIGWTLQAVLLPLGLDPALCAEVRQYLIGRLPAVLPMLLNVALSRYLQANGAARPVVISMVVGNLVNVPANLALAAGDRGLGFLGIPPLGLGEGLGVMGIGLASTVVAIAQFAVLYTCVRVYVPAPPDPDRPSRAGLRALFKVGLPVGLHFTGEMGVFATVAVLAGKLGPLAAGGHQVAIQLASFTFTVCLGVSSATAVRVGHARGRGDPDGVRLAGIAGMLLAAGFMACTGTAFALFPATLAGLLTNLPEVVVASTPLLRVAAVFQLFDGLQTTAAGALRGLGDTRWSMVLNFIGHWIFGLPIGVSLAWGLDLGAVGLWWGLTIGLCFTGTTLTLRFLRATARTPCRDGADR